MSKKYVYLFSEGNENMRELLGGKGANLAEMMNLGMPVPYGFTAVSYTHLDVYKRQKQVIIVAGYNKIVEDEEAAKKRIREIAAPANSLRLHKQTPCSTTGSCQDCYSKDRICSSYVKINYDKEDRIRVILIAEAYGY